MLLSSPLVSFVAATSAIVALLLVFNVIAVSIAERPDPDETESDWWWRIK